MISKVFSKAKPAMGAYSFSTAIHSPVCIIGSGAGGINVSSQLIREGVHPSEIRIFDPQQIHYYQPGWTMVGGGVIEPEKVLSTNYQMIPTGIQWTQNKITEIDPEKNEMRTDNDVTYTYDQLIISTGIENNYEAIPGMRDALEDVNCPVGTIYHHSYTQKWRDIMKQFKGGRAVFHQAPLPIKCPGAPQKIMHLSHDHWKNNKVRTDMSFYTGIPVIFGVPKYAKMLQEAADKKNINVNFEHKLIEVRGKERVAVFNDKNGNTKEVNFDVLHCTPHQRPVEFLRNNKTITDANGFVDVDPGTLRSKHFPNIWGIGDCTNCPTSKTAAAIMSETPVVVNNMMKTWKNKSDSVPKLAQYKGYTSCPLFVGDKKVILAEFKYNGEIDETFPFMQSGPSSIFYFFKTHFFPFAYFNWVPKGRWYGRNGFLKPGHTYI